MITNLTRRAFLRLTAGGSLAFAAGDLVRQFPGNWISQPLPSEMNIKPSSLIRYATTCRECPAGCGMHIRHINGRAIKAEGNPDHPVSRGGLCARGQSALQGLYDPDRLTRPHRREKKTGQAAPASWEEALRAIGEKLTGGRGRVFVISGLETGALPNIMRRFANNFDGDLLLYEPFDYRPQREAFASVVGEPALPWHALDRCRVILSLGADFLESWISNVQFTWMFSRMHGYRPGEPMGHLAYVGPRLSMTAANADDFLLVEPGALYDVAMNILKSMAERGLTKNNDIDYLSLTGEFRPEALPIRDAARRIDHLAELFGRSPPAAAMAGPVGARGAKARHLAEAVMLLNHAAGSFGSIIDSQRLHALGTTDYHEELFRLAENLREEDILLLHQANPVFTSPQLKDKLRQAGLIVSLTQLEDETSLIADWLLPVDNPLESWGEYSPWTSIRCYQQPTLRRLYDSRAAGDIFLSLADIGGRPLHREDGGATDLDFTSWLMADWLGERQGVEARKHLAGLLQAGFSEETPSRQATATPSGATQTLAAHKPAPPYAPGKRAADQAELWVWPSIFHFDGRTANRNWLLENPQPVSYIAWGGWIDIHPSRAAALGLEAGDELRIGSGERWLQGPARLTEEIAEQTVGLPLGLGHWALGKNAAGRGPNGFDLLGSGETEQMFVTVTLVKGERRDPAICLTAEREQHHREILRWEKLSRLEHGTHKRPKIDLPLPEGYAKKEDLYSGHEHADHRWAMVIDLHRCIGCGACAVACYAENNLAVLGPEPTREGREMAWLKVVPYKHPEKKGRIGFLPLLCQHCDQAPCEPVCPVFASVHTEDGLNAQVYNRCIGTRYCSQNCPYKVRRFNWLNPSWRPPLQWQLNPEVTVRSRGVMEKCTFCVQRIRQAEYRALHEKRRIRDGEIQPACAQSCPARVFTFGDLHDKDSEVNRLFRHDPRGYQLLHELNTKTAVLYLKKIEHDG